MRFNFIRKPGLFDVIGLAVVLVVVFLQGRTQADDGVFAFAPRSECGRNELMR